jgi:hypothetical protein
VTCGCNHSHERTTSCPCDATQYPPALSIAAALSTIPRQVATFPEVRAALLAALRGKAALHGWRARASDDHGVMLLEMWAYISDCISFYDEVIAHELYARTARRPQSLRKLVALIGYVPRPAVAATVNLAALAEGRQPVAVPAGTAFRSGAFDGEPPQVFELESPAAIHASFNQWTLPAPRAALFAEAGAAVSEVLVQQGTARAKQDDIVLLLHGNDGAPRRVQAVAPYQAKSGQRFVKVQLDAPVAIGQPTPLSTVRLLKPGSTASLWKLPTISGDPAPITTAALPAAEVSSPYIIIVLPEFLPPTSSPPLAGAGQPALVGDKAAHAAMVAQNTIVLDGLHRNIRAGEHVVLAKGADRRWFIVAHVSEMLRQLSGPTTTTIEDAGGNFTKVTSPAVKTPVTIVRLDADVNEVLHRVGGPFSEWSANDAADITLHYGCTDAGTVTVEAGTTISRGDSLVATGTLEQPEDLPPPGRFLFEAADGRGLDVTGTLSFTTGAFTVDPTVIWNRPLAAPVRLYGNVLSAARGETVEGELLGIGDASVPRQSFTLKKKPLTYLPLASPDTDKSTASTLRIYVDGVRWSEVPTFFAAPAESQVYIVREAEEGATVVTFGGGARLPSGSQVVAYYRFGAGAASPPAGSITQLAASIPGLRSVRNPAAASGGSDAEPPEEMRTIAPRSALLLGRAVSIRDVEAAAAASGARAVRVEWRWNAGRQRPVVQVYYIGDEPLGGRILRSLRGLTEPATPIAVTPAIGVRGDIAVDIEIDGRHLEPHVLADVRAALAAPPTGLLSPERVGIGVPLYRSRIFQTVTAVAGVAGIRNLTIHGQPFDRLAIRPAAGEYFDFEAGTLSLNGDPGR